MKVQVKIDSEGAIWTVTTNESGAVVLGVGHGPVVEMTQAEAIKIGTALIQASGEAQLGGIV